jgi:hypothetical protein
VFKVVDISGAIKTEERYHGYSIQLPLDICWVINDVAVEAYTAKVWKEDSILLRIPAFPYTLLYNREGVRLSDRSESVVNAMDNARHDYENNKETRQWKYLLLQFPPGQTLSSKLIFADAGDDEELDYGIVDIETRDNVTEPSRVERWVHFIVARSDLRVAKRGKVTKADKMSRMTAKLLARSQKGSAPWYSCSRDVFWNRDRKLIPFLSISSCSLGSQRPDGQVHSTGGINSSNLPRRPDENASANLPPRPDNMASTGVHNVASASLHTAFVDGIGSMILEGNEIIQEGQDLLEEVVMDDETAHKKRDHEGMTSTLDFEDL